jgi:hypothetical protein
MRDGAVILARPRVYTQLCALGMLAIGHGIVFGGHLIPLSAGFKIIEGVVLTACAVTWGAVGAFAVACSIWGPHIPGNHYARLLLGACFAGWGFVLFIGWLGLNQSIGWWSAFVYACMAVIAAAPPQVGTVTVVGGR